LNQQTIETLLDMGYEFGLVIKSLRALKDSKKYSPIGELQKAIDWMNSYLDK
jgi:hypothetical protein